MNINFFGPVYSCSGYAQLRHLFLRIARKGHNVKIKQMGTRDDAKILYEEEFKLLEKVELQKPYINITAGIGPAIRIDPDASYNIAYSMFETTEIPDKWIEFYNQFDEIWVPSKFCQKAFNRRDLTCHVHVIPFGVDESYLSYDKREHDLFTFFAVGQWIDRKGWDILIRAYISEFMGNSKVRLCIKTYNDTKTNEEMIREYLSSDVKNSTYMPRIMIKNQKTDEKDIPIFYQESDCFVLPSRGEAYGVPFVESMAMGIPVIAPDFGGQVDFVNDEVGWLIKIEQLRHLSERLCQINAGYKGLWFCEPAIEEVRKLMRYVFEHQQEAKEKGLKCRALVKKYLTWDIVAEKAESRLKEIFEVL
jgi:glycosyltransferase involved in cell wall biosynthesis